MWAAQPARLLPALGERAHCPFVIFQDRGGKRHPVSCTQWQSRGPEAGLLCPLHSALLGGDSSSSLGCKGQGEKPEECSRPGLGNASSGLRPPSLDGRPPTTMQGSRLWVAAEFRRHSYPGNAGGQRAGAAGAFGRMTRCAFIHRAQSFVVLHRLPLIHFTDGGTTECQGHFFFGQLEGFCPVRWCALCFPPRGAASPTSPCSKVKHHLLEGFCRRERQGNGGESKIQLWPPSLRHRSPWAQEPWALVQL